MAWLKHDQSLKKKKRFCLTECTLRASSWAMSKMSWTWCVWKGECQKGLNVQWGVKRIGSEWQIWILRLWIDSNGNGRGFYLWDELHFCEYWWLYTEEKLTGIQRITTKTVCSLAIKSALLNINETKNVKPKCPIDLNDNLSSSSHHSTLCAVSCSQKHANNRLNKINGARLACRY